VSRSHPLTVCCNQPLAANLPDHYLNHILPAAKIPGADVSVEDDCSTVVNKTNESHDVTMMMPANPLPHTVSSTVSDEPSNVACPLGGGEQVWKNSFSGFENFQGKGTDYGLIQQQAMIDDPIDESELEYLLMGVFDSMDPVDALIVMDPPDLRL
jgi:hypothetical protein